MNSVTLETGRSSVRRRWPSWLSLDSVRGRLLWLLILMGPAWFLDEPIYRFTDQRWVLRGTHGFRRVGKQFGEPMMFTCIALATWALDRSQRRGVAVLITAVVLAGSLAAGVKLIPGRARPDFNHGEHNVWFGPSRPGGGNVDFSFPSGHTTMAFAIACCLSQMYPQARWTFLLFGFACGVSRILSQDHFLTDVLVGAWFGWEVATLIWRYRLPRLVTQWTPEYEWLPRWPQASGHPSSSFSRRNAA